MITPRRYYQDSHQAAWGRAAAIFLFLLLAGLVVGAAMGWTWDRSGYRGASLLVSFVLGLGIGEVVGAGARLAHLRSTPLTGVLVGVICFVALYAAGVCFGYSASGGRLLAVSPDALVWLLGEMRLPLFSLMDIEYQIGKGGWLWAGEAWFFVIAALAKGLRRVRAGVYCEPCGDWSDQEIRLRCAPCDDVRHLRRSLEAEHYATLFELAPGNESHSLQTRLIIRDCSRCEDLSYLTLDLVGSWGALAGVFGIGETPIVRRLVVPKEIYAELERRTYEEWAQGGVEIRGGGAGET